VPHDRAHLRHFVAVGVTGLTLANGCGYFALQHVPAGFYVLVLPLSPILTVLFSAASGTERPAARVWLGVLCGLSGAALAMSPAAALPDPAALPWAVLALATPTFYALSNVLAMRLAPAGTPALPLAVGTLAAGGLALLPLALFAAPGGLAPGGAVLGGLALLVATMAAAYLLYFRLMAKAGAITTSLVGYTTTLFGIAWGVLIFAERPGWLVLPAAALVFGGLFLATRR
jgi:drug/metabolite transporter (DMT)-like permease